MAPGMLLKYCIYSPSDAVILLQVALREAKKRLCANIFVLPDVQDR